jgi:hypothetical protein
MHKIAVVISGIRRLRTLEIIEADTLSNGKPKVIINLTLCFDLGTLNDNVANPVRTRCITFHN